MNPTENIKVLVSQALSDGDLTLSNRIQTLMSQLKTIGVATEELSKFLEARLAQDALTSLTTEVYSHFTEEDLQNLERAFNTGLTAHQQLLLVLELYKRKANRDLEEYAVSVYEQMAKQVIKDLEKYTSILDRVKTVSDEKADEIIALVKEGNYDEAIKRFEANPTDMQTSAVSAPTQSLTEEDRNKIITLLSENKLEEAKQILNRI